VVGSASQEPAIVDVRALTGKIVLALDADAH
jgi:hypothetical protein